MKQLSRNFSVLLLCTMSFTAIAQTYPNLAGAWYVNGDKNIPAQITQNAQYLTFSYANGTSSGYFTTTKNQLYATDWKTYATLSADGNTITWDNQYWTRAAASSTYPDLSGKWYVNGDGAQPVQITQNGQSLNFSSGAGNSAGYFSSASQVYATTWTAYGNISSDRQTITWSNQTWTRKSNTSPQGNNKKYCRFELSRFYYASQALGTAWGRTGTEPATPTAAGVTAMQAHLELARVTFTEYQNCIQFDLNRLSTLRSQMPALTSAQIRQRIEPIITDLQAAITNAPFQCDNGVRPLAIYVAGIHLGAAQAWASAQQCRPVPMPAAIAGVIRSHLTTAQTALTPYTACLQATSGDGVTETLAFDFSVFGMVPLASLNSIEAHTFIVGIETQLLWAIALSDCCCTCKAGTGGPSACDQSCEDYCKKKGYQHGRYNNKTTCLLGVVSEGGCDCW